MSAQGFFFPPAGLMMPGQTQPAELPPKPNKTRKNSSLVPKNVHLLTKSQSNNDFLRFKRNQLDPEDVAHNLHVLKIEYNATTEENTQLKTRNKNLEAVINTLYEDLNQQQKEIQKIYQGKQLNPLLL